MIKRREGGNYLVLTMITMRKEGTIKHEEGRRELFSPDYDYEEGTI